MILTIMSTNFTRNGIAQKQSDDILYCCFKSFSITNLDTLNDNFCYSELEAVIIEILIVFSVEFSVGYKLVIAPAIGGSLLPHHSASLPITYSIIVANSHLPVSLIPAVVFSIRAT